MGMSERPTRVGVKLEPPQLIVIYSLELDQRQTRIRKIPIKQHRGKTPTAVVESLLSRPNHATLLRGINRSKLLSMISKLPDLSPEEEKKPESESIAEESVVEETPKKKFEMPLFSSSSENDEKSEKSEASIKSTNSNIDANIDDLLGLTVKPAKPVEEPVTIDAKEKTNLSFLDSDEDDDFKPLAQEKTEKDEDSKSSVASWLKSTSEERKTTNYSNSGFSDEEETRADEIEDNPYLANLAKAAQANNRRGSTESITESTQSEDTISDSISTDRSQLNDLSDAALAKAKAKMDVNFESNQLKPGDADFVYDKRASFNPTATCEWDDSIADSV